MESGITLQFHDQRPPLLHNPLSFPTSPQQQEILREVVHQLLEKNAIELVINPHSAGFYSRIFVVPKASGGWRPVIDLSILNSFVRCPHFQMETADTIRRAIQPGEWVTSIDISDAYLHVPVHPSTRHFFRFVFEGRVYQFRALPFGLNTAPREFTRLLRPVLAHLRRTGIRIHAYLDDWVIRASSHQQCVRHTELVLDLLKQLGWLVNWGKSELTPRQQFVFLGMEFDTARATVGPAPKHVVRLRSLVSQLRRLPLWSARRLYSLVGYLQFLAPLTHRGRMHVRPVQRWLRRRWNQRTGSWAAQLQVDAELVQHMEWWAHPDRFTGVPLVPPTPTVSLCTDASTHGWGAHLEDQEVSGVWDSDMSDHHINELELRAVLLAIRHFAPALHNSTARLYCDNATAVAYIRREGGTHAVTLSVLAEEILSECDHISLRLVPVHLPGVRNVRADALSRRGQALPGEWEIQSPVLDTLFREWGQPLVDMFATPANRKLPVFVSPFPHDAAWKVDALSFPWHDLGLVYLFPPPTIMAQVLRMIEASHGTRFILIAPDLPVRPWYPELRRLAAQGPRELPLQRWPLRQRVPGVRGWVHHQQPEVLKLAGWLLSSPD